MKQIREIHGLLWAWAAFCITLSIDDSGDIDFLWALGLYAGISGFALGALWQSKIYKPAPSWRDRADEAIKTNTPDDK